MAKHPIEIEIGGKAGKLVPDGGTYPQGVGAYIEVEIRKEEMNNSVSLCINKPMSWLPLSRRSARAIANNILELLGPETAADKDEVVCEYRHPL